MSFAKVVAIDGPCGSGKSTIARRLSEKLGALYVDTGAMFRALGFLCQEAGIAFDDEAKIENWLKTITMEYAVSDSVLIRINGRDLTETIREHQVSELASLISKSKPIRAFLLTYQRILAEQFCCVMEGRDIGTVVFPDAFCKIYLTAKPEIRATRRLDQLKLKGECLLTHEQVLRDVIDRDQRDMSRNEAPLKQADDAVLFDTSDLNIDQVLVGLEKIAHQKAMESKFSL